MSEPKPAHQRNVWTDAFREFDALYEAGAPERAARLDALLRQSPALADAVQRLLAEHDARGAARTGNWLDELPSALAAAAAPAGPADADPAPERIGPWRLLRELGHGGTSRVWLAQREDVPWVREVALKVPLMGLLRQDLRERLVRERDILSRLEHPHIARLYDAGFADDQPWLALEYVQGEDIATWCDAHRATLRERVQLFRQVLQAVQYAHAALIVHRDLKPANILVTEQRSSGRPRTVANPREAPLRSSPGAACDGDVRLLDFGIAKLIAEGQDHTQTTQLTQAAGRMLTPAYASPEQLRDDPLTTATDIYSLGVVLYQLLTGVHPFADRPRSASQIEQAIMDGQVALASRCSITDAGARLRGVPARALRRLLAGDLEAVLCKATLADPAARYESAAAFDADLEAWLDGRPVRARRPTLWQHTVKLVRRHPWASGLGVAAVCALGATTVVAVYQASQAREQAQHAQLEAARARSAKNFLLGLFDEAHPDRNGGRDVLARDLLTRGEQLIDRELAGQPQMKAEMLQSIGQVWWKFGDMDNAARVMQRRSEVAAAAAPGVEHVEALLDEVQVAGEAGQAARAAQRLDAARQVVERNGIKAPRILARLGLEQAWLMIKGRPPAFAPALVHLERAQSLAHKAGDVELEIDVIAAQASALRRQQRYTEAVRAVGRAEELVRSRWPAKAGGAPVGSVPERKLHILRLEKARNLWSQGAYSDGWSVADQLMHDVESWAGSNPNHFGLVNYRAMWFGLMVQLGMLDQAANWVDANPGKYSQLVMADPVQSVERHRWLAKLWVARSDWTRAAEALRRGMAVSGVAGSQDHAKLLVVQAEAQLRQRQTVQAERTLDQAEGIVLAADGARWLAMLDVKSLRAVAKAQAGLWPDAVRLAQETVAGAAQALGDEHPRTARARVHLAQLWLADPQRHQKSPDARQELALALPVLRRCYPPASPPLSLAESLIALADDSNTDASRRQEPSRRIRITSDASAFVL
jgi:serine/threonine protein kinase